ncbi:MAG: Uroporphyrinogen-III methyltransferase [Labilithrix sp.]|nr:Uroporphyrinogen-III methyltransferase [Labilithrix sp.]
MAGKVTFVGAGSGDPRLLTLRAAEVLEEADFVVFDPAVHPDILGRLREGTPRHPVTAQLTPERIGQLLAQEAKEGRHAVRLTWGDPLLFGTGDVEGRAVARHGVPLEIVPGIGPLISVGAFAGIPLTRTSDASPSVAAVSVTRGHETLHDWEKLATATDTLAIVCDAESVAETARSLVFHGRSANEPVTLVENVSLPTQLVHEMTLGQLPLLPPAKAERVVLVVGGEHAAPMRELSWLEKLPLFGKRILVTRAREQASRTANLLRERGADPVVVPTIEIHPPVDPQPMRDAAAALGGYGWVVLTSANGVERLWAELERQGKDARAFAGAKIAAIGPGTATALARCGLTPDLVPKIHKGEGLAEELLAAIGNTKARVLIARAEVARDVVPDALRVAGCEVDVVSVYKTLAPPRPLLDALAALLEAQEIDVVTFTSSSTVEHLCDALEGRAASLLLNTCVASIGPVTTETARKRGLRVDVTASEHTIPGLVTAIEGYFDLATTGTRKVTRIRLGDEPTPS